MKGSTFRRCGCRNPDTGKQWGKACPQLKRKNHGTWSLRQELPADAEANRRTFRRSGYDTAAAAQADLDRVRAILAIPDGDDSDGIQQIAELLASVSATGAPIPEYEETARRYRSGQSLTHRLSVAEWLDEWLSSKRLRPGGIARYECDVRVHLKPRIGHLRLDRLRVSHLAEMFQAIADANLDILEANALRRQALDELATVKDRTKRKVLREQIKAMPPFRRTTGAATRQHIRATLRAALNDAITQQLITFNPATHVDIEAAKRPKALVWTDERITRWQMTGEKPSPVMVWTPEQTGAFLDHVHTDRLYALWHLLTFRGLRRGEGCGLRWEDVDLDGACLFVATQLVQDGWDVIENAPKTDSSSAVVALDGGTVAELRAHRARQAAERLEWGPAWVDSGRVFTRENGEQLHPGWVSERFARLVTAAGLPPIRLHDLRHGAATLMLAAGAEIKLVQEMLRHSSRTITSDTYTSVLPEVALQAAEAAAALVPRTRAGAAKS